MGSLRDNSAVRCCGRRVLRGLARLGAVVLVAWLFWRPEGTYACVYRPTYPEMQLAVQEAVFLGRVERVDRLTGNPPIGLTLAVRRVWKGEVPSTADAQFQITCDRPPDFAPGKSYLFYGKEYEGKYLLADSNRIVPVGIGAWHDVLLLTAWDLRVVVPVLLGLQVLLRWRERRMMQAEAGAV